MIFPYEVILDEPMKIQRSSRIVSEGELITMARSVILDALNDPRAVWEFGDVHRVELAKWVLTAMTVEHE